MWLAAAFALPFQASAAVTRQPYLQMVTPTSAVIAWQTDLASPSDSQVRYGLAAGALDATASAVASTTAADPGLRNHAVLLQGLQPATRYYYAVGTASAGVDAGGTPEHYVTTSPNAGSAVPFVFFVLGDSGNLSPTQLAVRDAMFARPVAPAFVLHAGDMAYDTGTTSDFTLKVFAVYADMLRHTPLWPSIGNHEASDGASASATQSGPYFDAFSLPSAGQAGGVASGTEAYYSFDYANAHFVMLDADDSSIMPGSAQLLWLANDLAAVPAGRQWVIAVFHQPPYSKGSHDSDRASDSGGRMVRLREQVVPILEAGGVDLVLSGHSHSYERSYLIDSAYGYGSSPNFATPSFAVLSGAGKIVNAGSGALGSGGYTKQAGVYPHGGTVYVVSGHGGAELGGTLGHPVMRFSELQFGFCVVSVDGTSLTLQNVRSNGSVADTVALIKPPLCTLAAECDDSDACTVDSCAAGRCGHVATQCPSGQACNPGTGACACVAGACDDGNACTVDACDPVIGCGHQAVACDDADACTADACAPNTGCTHATIGCDDSNACTTDACAPSIGCTHAAIGCDDSDACTTDACAPARGCTHAAITCADDGNVCTGESCDPASGCVHPPRGGQCDDGQACTTGDQCQAGSCSGEPVTCAAQSDACNTGACDPATGQCVAVPAANGSPCPSGMCMGGLCIADIPQPVDAAIDSGASDASSSADSGATDSGSSSQLDAGAQPLDASVPPRDAAATAGRGAGDPSAGMDARPPTAGNASTEVEAGPDAEPLDAELPDASEPRPSNNEGCSTRSGADQSALHALWLLALWARYRRRRPGD